MKVSSFTHGALLDAGCFVMEQRGEIAVKGKGDMTTWLLKGCTDEFANEEAIEVNVDHARQHMEASQQLEDTESGFHFTHLYASEVIGCFLGPSCHA